jgi:transcriptional regulator with XRE-family HTH domain
MAPERLLLLREAHELSQHDLAQVLGISQAYLSQVEAGKKDCSPRVATKLADYFRIEKHVLYQVPRGTFLPHAGSRAS